MQRDYIALHIIAQVVDHSLWAIILRWSRLAVGDPLPATEFVEQRLIQADQAAITALAVV